MTENLFKFPIIQIDAEQEDKNSQLNELLNKTDDNIEFFRLEAELPFYDFAGVVDSFLPTEESREEARDGIFSNCFVTFNQGSYLVPWKKEKFKEELDKFTKSKEKKKKTKDVLHNA